MKIVRLVGFSITMLLLYGTLFCLVWDILSYSDDKFEKMSFFVSMYNRFFKYKVRQYRVTEDDEAYYIEYKEFFQWKMYSSPSIYRGSVFYKTDKNALSDVKKVYFECIKDEQRKLKGRTPVKIVEDSKLWETLNG